MPPSAPEDLSWEPLSEEELQFCWHALVDNGQLTVGNLRKFMSAVAGEDLTRMQANDLLGYLDATCDGRVSYEEFCYFMSFSELRLTDPKTFLYAPTKKFREERGMNIKLNKKFEEMAEHAHNVLEDDFKQVSEARKSPRPSLKHPPPSAPVAKAGKVGSASPSRRGPRKGKSDDPEERTAATPAAEAQQTTAAKATLASAKTKKLEVDPKFRAKIATTLEKFEATTWDKLLHEQESIRKKLFQQFAVATPVAMNITEYHKMVLRLHKLARHNMPGEPKPADSLAALQFIIEQNQSSAEGDEEKGEDAAIESAIQTSTADLKLTYELWHRKMRGGDGLEAKVDKGGK